MKLKNILYGVMMGTAVTVTVDLKTMKWGRTIME